MNLEFVRVGNCEVAVGHLTPKHHETLELQHTLEELLTGDHLTAKEASIVASCKSSLYVHGHITEKQRTLIDTFKKRTRKPPAFTEADSSDPMFVDLRRSSLTDKDVRELVALDVLIADRDSYQITYPRLGGGASPNYDKKVFGSETKYFSRKNEEGGVPHYPLILDVWKPPQPSQDYEVFEGGKKLMAGLRIGMQGSAIAGSHRGVTNLAKQVSEDEEERPKELPVWRLHDDLIAHIRSALNTRPDKSVPLRVVLSPDGDATTNRKVNHGWSVFALSLLREFSEDEITILVRKYTDPTMKLDDLLAAGLSLEEHTKVVPWREVLWNFSPRDAYEVFGLRTVSVAGTDKKAAHQFVPPTLDNVLKMVQLHPAFSDMFINEDEGVVFMGTQRLPDQKTVSAKIARTLAERCTWRPKDYDFPVAKVNEAFPLAVVEPWFPTRSPKMERVRALIGTWDGKNRLDTFASDYFHMPVPAPGTLEFLWTRALLTGALQRILHPGSVFRFAHYMVNNVQGGGKSGFPAAMLDGIGGKDYTSLWTFKAHDGTVTEGSLRTLYMIRGIANMDDIEKMSRELRSLIKGLISGGSVITGTEAVRLLYENEVFRLRPNVLYSSSNYDDILIADPSGQTRHAVIHPNITGKAGTPGGIDYAAIKKVSAQLIAECLHWINLGRFSEQYTWDEFENVYMGICSETAQESVSVPESHVRAAEALVRMKCYMLKGKWIRGIILTDYSGSVSKLPKGEVYAVRATDFNDTYTSVEVGGKITFKNEASRILGDLGFVSAGSTPIAGKNNTWIIAKAKFLTLVERTKHVPENGELPNYV